MSEPRQLMLNDHSSGDITLRDLVAPLFRHKRTVITTFLLAVLLTIAAAVKLSGSYETHLEVLVNRERLDPVMSTESQTQLPGGALSAVTPEEINSEGELLKSGDVLEKVVLQNGLQKREQQSLWAHLHPEATETQYVSRAVKHLGTQLTIEPLVKTNLISVSYKSADPQIAYGVLNALATLYVDKHVAVHRPTGAYDFFAKEADKYRNALGDSEAPLATFDKQEGAVPGVERADMALGVANSIVSLQQDELAVAADEQRIAADNDQMKMIPERSATLQSSNSAALLLQQLQGNLLAAQLKRTQLLLKFEPSYPLVQEADQEIAATQAAIADAQKTQYVNETTDRDSTFELLREDLAKTKSDLAAQRAGVGSLKSS